MRCKHCGRELNTAKSIERGCGPECYKKQFKGFNYQLELRFTPLIDSKLSMTEQHEIIKRLLESKI